MNPFDVGIPLQVVVNHLRRSSVLSIVGFEKSGKSTLAEKLTEDLAKSGFKPFMHNASCWLPRGSLLAFNPGRTPASVDAEVASAIERLRQNGRASCWIVDDAEVLLAYATRDVLQNLGKRLHEGDFSLLLVRNRFVREDKGWFLQRQSLISSEIPRLVMRPLGRQQAIEVATAMFHGNQRDQQGTWLAEMSGGIPGLMTDLYRYTPKWPSHSLPQRVMAIAVERRKDLELNRPIRRQLLEALRQRALPPIAFLSEEARTELGALAVAGMVSFDYAFGPEPFNGRFWRIVADQEAAGDALPEPFVSLGLNLEIIIQQAGLTEPLIDGFDLPTDDSGTLAQSFATTLFCQQEFPGLCRTLDAVLTGILGRFGLSRILKSQGKVPTDKAEPAQLAKQIIQHARLS